MPSRKNLIYFLTLSILVLVFVAAYQWVLSFDNKLYVVFCDVGQGDSIYIRTPKGVDILVDGGPDRTVLKCLQSHMPFWDRKIELIVLSNADADHYTGLIDVVRGYTVERFAVSEIGKSDTSFEILEQEVYNRGIAVVTLEKGDRFRIGEIRLETLWPERSYINTSRLASYDPKDKQKVLGTVTSQQSVNEFSVVQLLTYKSFDLLLTGDIAPPATERLVAIPFESVEVLKVPHHGSRNGLTQGLLDVVRPQLAVISNGKNNRYGHPHNEILEMLKRKGITTLRTDVDGEIEIVSDGKKWWVAD